MRPAFRLAAVLFLVLSARSLRAADDGGEGEIRTLADLNGRRLGVIVGTMLDSAANQFLDFTDLQYYETGEEQTEALFRGDIDALLEDEPVARFRASRDARLRVVPGRFMDDGYGFALRGDDGELFDRIDGALAKRIGDGEIRRLEARWFDSTEGEEAAGGAPADSGTGGERVLRFGVSPVSAPFVYAVEGRLVGFDIDLMRLLAGDAGMRLEVVGMDFSELIPSLRAGKVDVVGSCMSITEERARLVRFTGPYYRGGAVALVLR